MSKEIFEKASVIVDEYNEQFAKKGITCKISRKYFEEKVFSLSHHYGTLQMTERKVKEKREKDKFKNVRNRYQVIVLSFCSDKIKSKNKEYAFLIRRTDRADIGVSPETHKIDCEKVLNKIRKRLEKVLNKAEKLSAEKICKNTFGDILRYFFSAKYNYQQKYKQAKSIAELISIITISLAGLIFYVSTLLK